MVVNLSISLLSICGGIEEQKIEPISFLHLSLLSHNPTLRIHIQSYMSAVKKGGNVKSLFQSDDVG